MQEFMEHMNRLHDLFLKDKRMHTRHISLYMALLLRCHRGGGGNPFVVTRSGLMELSKIRSKTTYHKCIKELVAFGYIDYAPTYDYHVGTKIKLILS